MKRFIFPDNKLIKVSPKMAEMDDMEFFIFAAEMYEYIERQRQTRIFLDANTDSEMDTDSEPDHSDVDDEITTAEQSTN